MKKEVDRRESVIIPGLLQKHFHFLFHYHVDFKDPISFSQLTCAHSHTQNAVIRAELIE